MSEGRSVGSHAMTWALSLCFAVPSGSPRWLISYCKPFQWLSKDTPLETPLQAYDRWLWRVTG
jgi:hypothetical protein